MTDTIADSAAQPRLSLCMIVRNNANTLIPCLESIRPWVDEMIVVDTGSTDETPQIAERLGAKVFHFPWIDDFSAARNESLKHARGAWIFWMDSDDTKSPENGRRLRELAYGFHAPSTFGYVMQVHCPGGQGAQEDEVTAVDQVKLFRNDPRIRFEGRLHEQVLPSIRRLGGEILFTDIFVVHSGADHSPEVRRRKYERDLRILHSELRDSLHRSFVLFNLGMTHFYEEVYREAAGYLEQCIRLAKPHETQVRKAYALLVSSYTQLGDWEAALNACRAGRGVLPKDPELLFREGVLWTQAGNAEAAEESYCSVLENDEELHFTSIVQGIVGYKSRHNLAVVYNGMGRLDLAEFQWRAALEEAPTFLPARRGLIEALLGQGRFITAEVELDRMASLPSCHSAARALRCELLVRRGQLVEAQTELESTVVDDPTNVDGHQALCKFLFQHGSVNDAERSFVRLLELEPLDAAAHNNLGLVYLRNNRLQLAIGSFRESLRLRPNAVVTLKHLAYTHESARDFTEASKAWQQILQLRPDDAESRAALDRIWGNNGINS